MKVPSLLISLLLVAVLATPARAAQPGCPATSVVAGQFVVPVYSFYAGQNIWQLDSIKCSDFSTSEGTISWLDSLDGGSLAVVNFGAVATVAFTVSLIDNQNSPAQQICSYQARGGASGQGDPHFKGFDGSMIDFNGVAGETYELISLADTLVNIQMVKRGYLTGIDGQRYLLPQYNGTATWIGALAVVQGETQVSVSKDEQEIVSVRVNDQELSLGAKMNSGTLDISVQEESFPGELWGGMPIVIITTAEFTIEVSMPPNFSQRLDVSVNRNNDALPAAEGILGRTLENLYTGRPLDDDLTDAVWIEEADNRMTHSKILDDRLTSAYRTSGLFATDARLSCYTAAASSQPAGAEFAQVTRAESTAEAKEAPIAMPKSVSRRRLLMA